MTRPQLTVENAEVKTAAVEVKVLTLSGKQVTLAVFRQMPTARLLNDADMTLNGIPWGTVNYHPDKCGDDREHLHVVWQKEKNLYRDRVNIKESWPFYEVLDLSCRVFASMCLRAYYTCPRCSGEMYFKMRRDAGIDGYKWHDDVLEYCENGHAGFGYRWDSWRIGLNDWEVKRSGGYSLYSMSWKCKGEIVNAEISANSRVQLYQEALKIADKHNQLDMRMAQLCVENAVERKQSWPDQYKNYYASLKALDQLYIAI